MRNLEKKVNWKKRKEIKKDVSKNLIFRSNFYQFLYKKKLPNKILFSILQKKNAKKHSFLKKKKKSVIFLKKTHKKRKKMLRRTTLFLQFAEASSFSSSDSPLSKLKLKSAQDYMKMPTDELKRLLAIRDDQLSELKQLHDKAHTSVEYVHRKQMLDWEEHATHFAQAAGVMTGDTLMNCRERCKDIRLKNDTEDRDRWIVFWALVFLTMGYWWWLSKHYKERPDAPKGRGQSHRVVMGPSPFNMFGDGRTWSSRHVDTAWEAEKNQQKRDRENARFPKDRPDASVRLSDIMEGKTTPDGMLKPRDDNALSGNASAAEMLAAEKKQELGK
jgi:hypothetical protein